MYNFCIKIDKKTADGFRQQILASSCFQINNMEMEDCFDGTNLAEISGGELEKYRRLLIEHNRKIVLLDSSIAFDDTDRHALLFRKAHLLGIENIKVNISWVLSKENEEYLGKLMELLRIGKSYGIGVVFENNRSAFTGSEKNLSALFKKLAGCNPGIIFNPLEYAAMKVHPFFHAFYNSRLKSDIRFLRVNDGLFEDGNPMLPGEGNAELKELTSALLARSYKGYFSFEPYLDEEGRSSYATVIKRFKKILMEI